MRTRTFSIWSSVALLFFVIMLGACGSTAVPELTGGPAPTGAASAVPEPTTPPSPTTGPVGLPLMLDEGFEAGLDNWQTGADVPDDPNRPGQTVAWSIETSQEQSLEGLQSARFQLDGRQADGTIWLVRVLTVPPGQDLAIDVSFDLWSQSKSFNALANAAVYAGPRPPDVEGDFDLSQAAGMDTGWRRYTYGLLSPSSEEGRLWLAVGISAVWESEWTYYLDNVRIAVDAVSPQVKPPPAILVVGDQEQISGIGSYCWSDPEKEMAVCADTLGVITPQEPITVPTAFTAQFRLAPEGTPRELSLRVAPASPQDELKPMPEGWRAWPGGQGELYNLALEREPEVELNLVPGQYTLELWAAWENWGSVGYGFLIDVEPELQAHGDRIVESASRLPILLVTETPVVADEVDRPGHMEYMDRLGEEILTRLDGLRNYTTEHRLARTNAALAPFGYRLEPRFDAEWDRTFYDLFHDDDSTPVLPRLAHLWPVTVNASGTDFALVAENAPNVFPLFLEVNSSGIQEWDAAASNWLPPVFVADSLAVVSATQEVTFTYQVVLDGRAVYTGTAAVYGAYHPLRSFTTWDGHWVLEVDDHIIVDGQDLGQAMGYDAAYNFALIHGQPLYFFEQDGVVRISYAGQTLPHVYDEVIHNQCCEAAMFNVETHDDLLWFHALWGGTWHFVEAGVYDGEMSGTARYTAAEGWTIRYPAHWTRLEPDLGFVQDPATGRTVTFGSAPTSQAELERWIESEIARKLDATEADNALVEPLTTGHQGNLAVYRYTIGSKMDGTQTLLRTTIFFDGQRRYEFHTAIPPVTGEEYEAILASFQPARTP